MKATHLKFLKRYGAEFGCSDMEMVKSADIFGAATTLYWKKTLWLIVWGTSYFTDPKGDQSYSLWLLFLDISIKLASSRAGHETGPRSSSGSLVLPLAPQYFLSSMEGRWLARLFSAFSSSKYPESEIWLSVLSRCTDLSTTSVNFGTLSHSVHRLFWWWCSPKEENRIKYSSRNHYRPSADRQGHCGTTITK